MAQPRSGTRLRLTPRGLAACAALIIMLLSAAGAARADELMGAASAEHIWFVIEGQPTEDRLELRHHALDMPGPHYHRAITISRIPEAMAAWDHRAWLIMPPRVAGDELRREVFTIRAVFEPGLELYQTSPQNRLEIVAPLPGHGRLAGVVGTERGPVALIVPDQVTQENGRPPDETDEDTPVEGEAEAITLPVLLELSRGRWQPIALPDGAGERSPQREPAADADQTEETAPPGRNPIGPLSMLSAAGAAGEDLIILTAEPERSGVTEPRSSLYRRDADGKWHHDLLPIDFRQVRSLLSAKGRPAALIVDGDRAHIRYLRRGAAINLTSFGVPQQPWIVLGVTDGFRLIVLTDDDTLRMHRMHAITGELGPEEIMREQRMPAGRLWHMSFMLAVAVMAIVLVLLIRPSTREKVELPPKTAVIGPFQRLIALVLDLVPGAVLTMLILRCGVVDLLRPPIVTDSFEQALPYTMMVLIAMLHAGLTEVFRATTLGKALLGAKVIAVDGSRPPMQRLLMRQAVKLLILLVPPLAIVMILNPNWQGVNDLLARTVVVAETVDGEEEKTDTSGNGDTK